VQAPSDAKAAEADYAERIKRASAGARIAPAASAAGVGAAGVRAPEQALGYQRCTFPCPCLYIWCYGVDEI